MSHPKIGRTRAYLESEFPGLTIVEEESVPRDSFLLTVRRAEPRETHRALVTREFLNDTPEDQIEGTLRAWHLAEEMRRAEGDSVVVASDGLKGLIPSDL